MNFDPSDYEKMCLFADYPLIVNINPIRSYDNTSQTDINSPHPSFNSGSNEFLEREIDKSDISCCNVDILPVFLDLDKMCVKKRMEPMINPIILQKKSWENLPLLTMELTVKRNPLNAVHHDVLKRANYMKLTLVAAYNMLVSFDDDYIYTAASQTPLHGETQTGLVLFNQGYRKTKKFNNKKFYPKWESLRVGDSEFTKCDENIICDLEELQNKDDIDLKYYTSKLASEVTTVWGSFHRTLMLKGSNSWLYRHLISYHWPLEVHVFVGNGGYSFMCDLDLFKLLYPGETTVRLAVPLQWVNPQEMMEKCGCEPLLIPNDPPPETPDTIQTAKLAISGESAPGVGVEEIFVRSTGLDGNPAFVIVEVKLAQPLKKMVIPPIISSPEIEEMLNDLESGCNKRECRGRGQLDRNWHSTVRFAVNSLGKVPHYGMTEFCNFNRQLSETRTRVELVTSFWQDAAVFINNKFIIQDFIYNDDTYEEMLMMAHACLVRVTCQQLIETNENQNTDPILRAARHARQMQDISHAVELYMQVVTQAHRDNNAWRELSTCLMDVDGDWSDVCLTKSMEINPRHPLTLLSKACVVFDENREAAESFFTALISLYPFWTTGLTVANAYYIEKESFHTADTILEFIKSNKRQTACLVDNIGYPRNWDNELGDWWEQTPLLPGISIYCDAADILLRLRALTLAEVCVSRTLAEDGETAAYFHLVALCCRLRGDYDQALCHLKKGLEKFGEISYLRSLEAECLHKKSDIDAAMASIEKAGNNINSYSTLLSLPCRESQRARSVLVDLIRRHPSAYVWMALADDWMKRARTCDKSEGEAKEVQASATTCAIACAVQAIKWDRRAGRAWALLAKLVMPNARKSFCKNMAIACGYHWSDHHKPEPTSTIKHSCPRLGTALRECRCNLCQNLKM